MVLLLTGPVIGNCVDAVPDILQVGFVISLILVELQVRIVQDHAGDLGPDHTATGCVRKVEIVEVADENWSILLCRL